MPPRPAALPTSGPTAEDVRQAVAEAGIKLYILGGRVGIEPGRLGKILRGDTIPELLAYRILNALGRGGPR